MSDKTITQTGSTALYSHGIKKTSAEEKQVYYKNVIHQQIFENRVNRNPCRCSNKYLAALYLLTANKELWDASKQIIGRKSINFSRIIPKNFTATGYTLFTVAKDIYVGEIHITIKDLCDRQLVSDQLFDLFLSAFYISRLGYAYIGIEKAPN